MKLWPATLVVRRLAEGELTRGRRLLTASALLFLPAVAALVLAAFGRWGLGIYDELLELDLAFLTPFLPATLLGSAVADELDRGTAGFLFVRPAPRAALLTGRLTAVLPAIMGSAVLSLAIGFFALHARYLGDIPRALPHFASSSIAVMGGLLLYSALALSGGAALRKRPVAALLVLFAVDASLARSPVMLRLLSPAYHLRLLAGLPESGMLGAQVAVPLWASALYLLALLAATTAFGVRRVRAIEMTGEAG